MSQFSLSWNNTEVLSNSNAISQRALYRVRQTGGAWQTSGFTPANDMAKTVNSAISGIGLYDNTVYEFKVQTICNLSGPTDNDNGIREMIGFSCITPVLNKTTTTADATINVTGTDITKARFTLKRTSDSVIMLGPLVVDRSGNGIGVAITTLAPATSYYWQIELYATLNGLEVISSQAAFLNTVCGNYPFTTDTPPVCNPITAMTVVSVQI